MLKSAISYVRRQPKPVRERYAFLVAASFTGVIVLVWVVTLPQRFAAPAATLSEEEASPSMFSTFFSQAKEQLATVSESFKDVKATLATSTATTTSDQGEIVLSEAELLLLRARPTTTPQVAIIATTTPTSAASTTISTATTSSASPRPATTTSATIRIATTTAPSADSY